MTQIYHVLAQQGGYKGYHIDWGSIPAYFGGLALLLTVYTLSRDHRDRRRSQAKNVVAWADQVEDGYKLFLRNKSELPVTDVIISLQVGYEDRNVVRLDKFSRPDRWHKPQYVDVLPPDHTKEVRSFARGPVWVSGLSFIDSSGSQWRRTDRQLRLYKSHRVVRWAQERRRLHRLRTTDGYDPSKE